VVKYQALEPDLQEFCKRGILRDETKEGENLFKVLKIDCCVKLTTMMIHRIITTNNFKMRSWIFKIDNGV